MANDVNLPLIFYHLDLKLGISEKSIFYEFHSDAEDLLNVTYDFKLVCEKLRDRSQRHKHQVAQFLVGLAEPPAPNTAPRIFLMICKWNKSFWRAALKRTCKPQLQKTVFAYKVSKNLNKYLLDIFFTSFVKTISLKERQMFQIGTMFGRGVMFRSICLCTNMYSG
ncbi:hypothetical protein RDI58_000832 [Solanum bulbocastanum]|uniref:Uncharacterized protein n=1 Tax=Solanum bulbocastanum TaxID=147425 RepID=A0AAN8U6W9_SOLBU